MGQKTVTGGRGEGGMIFIRTVVKYYRKEGSPQRTSKVELKGLGTNEERDIKEVP